MKEGNGRMSTLKKAGRLKRATDNAKKGYLENIYNEIMEFQRTGRCDLMNMKIKELGRKETQGIQNISIKDSQENRKVKC
jgi:glutamate mutase epsilon subunit